jgi:hypothetical protein
MTDTTNHVTRPALAALQTRLRHLEKKAERRVTAILADTRGVYEAVREKWPGMELTSHLKRVAAEGQTRFAEVVKRAEIAGAEALGHAARLQGAAVGALGFATRDQIHDLTREVKRLARKVEQPTRRT